MPCKWKPSNTIVISSIVGLYASYIAASKYLERYFGKKIQVQRDTPDEAYIKRHQKAFVSTYSIARHFDKFNENIEPEFYKKDEYNRLVAESDNRLEAAWKRRILHEATPRGNITMYYDAYKQAFAYYADVAIPYSILNAVAMKYVRTFSCRDFFLDESVTPKGNTSPFIRIHVLDDSSKKTGVKFDVKNGPFAKLKKYTDEKPNERKTDEVASATPQNIIRNKFVYLGKSYNFSILNKTGVETVDKRKKHAVSDKPMKYSDFKSWRNPEATVLGAKEGTANYFDAVSE